MNPLVVDASVVCAWFLEDETDDYRVRERLEHQPGITPPIFHLEIRNALLVAHRRGRLSGTDLTDHIASLATLPLQTDDRSDIHATFGLALRRQLSLYDALYLELAKRSRGVLATLDRALARAAVAEQVELIGKPPAVSD